MKTNYTYFLTSYTGVITKSFFFIKKHLHRLLLTVFVSALFSMAGNAQQTYSEYSFEETSGEDVLDSNSSNDGKIVDDGVVSLDTNGNATLSMSWKLIWHEYSPSAK